MRAARTLSAKRTGPEKSPAAAAAGPRAPAMGSRVTGHQSWNSGMPSPEHPTGPARDCPDPEASGQATCWEKTGDSELTQERTVPSKALPPSPGQGWGHARCHWGSCTPMQACCCYWGRNLRGEEKGRHSQVRSGWSWARSPVTAPSLLGCISPFSPEEQKAGGPALSSLFFMVKVDPADLGFGLSSTSGRQVCGTLSRPPWELPPGWNLA